MGIEGFKTYNPVEHRSVRNKTSLIYHNYDFISNFRSEKECSEMPAPAILFVYNRPQHTALTLQALQKNDLASHTELFVFSDGPKKEPDKEKVAEVRKVLHETSGFKKINIIEKEKNQRLANSIITGVSEIINRYGEAIILEDDLITSPNFLSYMNDALDHYKSDNRIFSIAGYSLPIQLPAGYKHDVYLSYRGSSWGWATWKDRWNSVDWDVTDRASFLSDKNMQEAFNQAGEDLSPMLIRQLQGKIDSWAIRFAYSAHKQHKLHLAPVSAKVKNIGQDNTGTHSGKTSKYDVTLDAGDKKITFPESLELVPEIVQSTRNFFKKNIVKKIAAKVIGLLS